MERCDIHPNFTGIKRPASKCEYCISYYKFCNPKWETHKKCSKCKESKNLSLFHKSRNNRSGLNPRCKICAYEDLKLLKSKYSPAQKEKEAARKARWMAKNKKQNKDWHLQHHLKNKYNLSLKDLEILKKFQNNKCCICNKNLEKPFVDHDHETGQIRGVLCRFCNTGLGFFQDSVSRLINAINYLECNISNREEKRFELNDLIDSENKQ